MELNMDTFLDLIDPTIRARGAALYQHGAVMELRQVSPGAWKARVQGSRLYTTKVELSEDEVEDYSCTCPYDWGPVCKHIYATVLAIENSPPDSIDYLDDMVIVEEEMAVREMVKEYAKGIKRDDLLEFITELSEKNPAMLEAFKLRFAGRSPGNPPPSYPKMIADAMRKAEKYGEWGYIAEEYLEEVLEKLQKRSTLVLKQGKWAEVFEINHAVLSLIPQYIERIPEDIEGVEDGVIFAADAIGDLLAGEAPPEMKHQFVERTIPFIGQEDIRSWGFDDSLWEALVAANLSEAHWMALLEQVDRVLSTSKPPSQWGIEGWLERKSMVLRRLGRADEASGLLESYMHLPGIRQVFVDAEREAGRYYKAKILIREGMEIEEKADWPGNTRRWREQLLEIARIEQDTGDIRVHARALFGDASGDFKYYELLKSTFSPEEWKSEVEKILDNIRAGRQHGGYYSAERIAQIFAREGYHDRLLSLLTSNSGHYRLIKAFYHPLRDLYPDEVSQLFRKAIEIHVERNTGRGHYHELVEMLKSLGDLKGGTQLRNELLQHFRTHYKRRSAMMEILDLAFKK